MGRHNMAVLKNVARIMALKECKRFRLALMKELKRTWRDYTIDVKITWRDAQAARDSEAEFIADILNL